MSWSEGVEEKRDKLQAAYPPAVFGKVHVDRSIDFVNEYTGAGSIPFRRTIDVKDLGWSFSIETELGSDELEIGGVEDARQLISDLQAAIDYCLNFEGTQDLEGRE